MANRRGNCILVVGLLFLALTAHLHHAAPVAGGGGDGKNLVRWRKAMEIPRHPSPMAPRKLGSWSVLMSGCGTIVCLLLRFLSSALVSGKQLIKNGHDTFFWKDKGILVKPQVRTVLILIPDGELPESTLSSHHAKVQKVVTIWWLLKWRNNAIEIWDTTRKIELINAKETERAPAFAKIAPVVGTTSVQIKINNQPPRNLKRYIFVNVTDQMIQLDDMLRKIVHGCSIARPNKLQYDHLVKEEWND
nr:hypothetical protein Iba_chr02dCG15350 [Ipomoea batatas]